MRRIKNSIRNKIGMGTVEVVIIIAVLVAIALTFRSALTSFAEKLMDDFMDASKVTNSFNKK